MTGQCPEIQVTVSSHPLRDGYGTPHAPYYQGYVVRLGRVHAHVAELSVSLLYDQVAGSEKPLQDGVGRR